MVRDSQTTEMSRITFVFETRCTANCKFYFLAVRRKLYLFTNTHFWMYTGKEVRLDVGMNIYERSVCLCRVIISGIMMWWSTGRAVPANSRTLT